MGRRHAISDEEIASLVMILRNAAGLELNTEDAQATENDDADALVDVVITKTSGKLGVCLWMNSYLDVIGQARVNEDDSAVEAVHRWVEAQYAEGREDAISDEEMLTQATAQLQAQSTE